MLTAVVSKTVRSFLVIEVLIILIWILSSFPALLKPSGHICILRTVAQKLQDVVFLAEQVYYQLAGEADEVVVLFQDLLLDLITIKEQPVLGLKVHFLEWSNSDEVEFAHICLLNPCLLEHKAFIEEEVEPRGKAVFLVKLPHFELVESIISVSLEDIGYLPIFNASILSKGIEHTKEEGHGHQ